jgi:hypothetical protein
VDEHAAVLLVSEYEYRDAERVYGPSLGAVAAELAIPQRFVERLRDLTRSGAWPSTTCSTCVPGQPFTRLVEMGPRAGATEGGY